MSQCAVSKLVVVLTVPHGYHRKPDGQTVRRNLRDAPVLNAVSIFVSDCTSRRRGTGTT